MLGKTVIVLIRIYQKTISPDRGILRGALGRPTCVMYPSCSDYTIIAIQKYGLAKGLIKGVRRILSCNPFQKRLVDMP